MFNECYFVKLTEVVGSEYRLLNKKRFKTDLMSDLEKKELNERMSHTATVLYSHLPEKFTDSIKIIDRVVSKMSRGYTSLVFPDFVAKYGLEHVDLSLDALKRYTVYGSSEFAIRIFLKKDFDKTISVMYSWADDKNMDIRRLASEGSRPRLPWSFKLDQVIQNPTVTRPILEKLKADPEIYVRKSVANHLNDVSKDHPDYMISLINTWDRSNEYTAWIIKHASRTLIKKGHPNALKLFDAHRAAKVKIIFFSVSPVKIKLGEKIEINLGLVSLSKSSQKLIIDYILYYIKKDGDGLPKVFKWTEFNLLSGQEIQLTKKQRIVDFTTRKHYPGRHKIVLQINGKQLMQTEFELEAKTD